MMDFYKYRLLGHKPSQHGPKASENLGSALELQDTQAAPKPGVYCGTLCTEGFGGPTLGSYDMHTGYAVFG